MKKLMSAHKNITVLLIILIFGALLDVSVFFTSSLHAGIAVTLLVSAIVGALLGAAAGTVLILVDRK
jgi:uncharacterized integral membrane protein